MPNCDAVVAEFTLEKLNFNYENKDVFLSSSCLFVSKSVFLVYRVILLLAIVGFTVFDILYITQDLKFNFGYWFLFPSNHALVIYCGFHIYWTVLMAGGLCLKEKGICGTNILWLLYVLSVDLICATTGFYWVVLYSYTAYADDSNSLPTYNSYFHMMHVIPISIVLIDLLFTNIPIRMAHLLYPILASALYMVFSAIYYKSDPKSNNSINTLAYPHIDWSDKEGAPLGCVLIIIMVTACHCLLYIICVFKEVLGEASAKIDSDLEMDAKQHPPSPSGSPTVKKMPNFP